MKAIDGKKIAIVGGGPGGLTLARLLQQSGAQVSVYERDHSRHARVQGSARISTKTLAWRRWKPLA